MHQEEPSFFQHVENSFGLLINFLRNFQNFVIINIFILILNGAVLWIISSNKNMRAKRLKDMIKSRKEQQQRKALTKPKYLPQTLKEVSVFTQEKQQCENPSHTLKSNLTIDTNDSRLNSSSKSSILRCACIPARKRISTPPTNKITVMSEECDETLDEITWGCDESASPVMAFESVIPSERFILSSPERSGVEQQLKRKRLCAHRRRKRGPAPPQLKEQIPSRRENMDSSCRAIVKTSPKLSMTEIDAKLSMLVSDLAAIQKNSTTVRVEPNTDQLKRDRPVSVRPFKKQQCRPMHSQKLDSLIPLEPCIFEQSMKNSGKSRGRLEKLWDGSRGSQKAKQKPKKLSKKKSHLSTVGTLEKLLTSHETINYSNSGEESLSSPGQPGPRMDILDQLFVNPSESTTVCKRDSWIWFSPETRPSIESFTSRPRKLRSQDPRVVALAAEIKRQELLNRDIERTAESLIDTSSSPSLGGATSRAGKYGGSKSRAGRRSQLMPYNKFHKHHRANSPPIPHHKVEYPSPVKSKRAAKTAKTPSAAKLHKGATSAPDKSKSKKTLPDKKMPARKISNDNDGLSSNSMDTQLEKRGDRTFSLNSGMDEFVGNDRPQTGNNKSRQSRDFSKTKDAVSSTPTWDRHRSFNQSPMSLNDLSKRNELSRAPPLSPVTFRLTEPSSSVPNMKPQPGYYYDSDENVLKLSPTSTRDSLASLSNTQYLLSCLEAQLRGRLSNTASPDHLQEDARCTALDRAEFSSSPLGNQRFGNKQSNPAKSQTIKEERKLVWSPVYQCSPKSRRSPSQIRRNHSLTQATKSGPFPVASKPQEASKEKLAANPSSNSSTEYSSWLKLYHNQLASKSNSAASRINSDEFSAERSPLRSSSIESKYFDYANKVKDELGASHIEDFVNQEVNTAIHKLLFDSDRSPSSHSQCSTPANHFHDFLDDPKYQTTTSEHYNCDMTESLFIGEKKNFGERLIVENTQTRAADELNEIINKNITHFCDPNLPVDTCMLNSMQSTGVNTALTNKHFSAAEKPKRTNIYTRNYYLGKRAAHKTNKETRRPLLRPADSSSLSRWKKTNITWSKTVSLHLYSPTTRPISPKTRRRHRQKNLEKEKLKKLKPCLKATCSLTEQSCSSLSDDTRDCTVSSPHHTRNVMSDSVLTQKPDKDTIQNNEETSSLMVSHSSPLLLSIQQYENTKQTTVKPVKHCSVIPRAKKYDSLSPRNKTKVSPVVSKCKTRDTSYRKQSSTSNLVTGVARKESSLRQGLNKPTVTVSKNNSSSIVPYRSCKSITSCRSKLPTPIAQLFFVTQTDICPHKKCSKSQDFQLFQPSKTNQTCTSDISHLPVKPLESGPFSNTDAAFVNSTYGFNSHINNFKPQNIYLDESFLNTVNRTSKLENMTEVGFDSTENLSKRKSLHISISQSGIVDSEHKHTGIKPEKYKLHCRNYLPVSHKVNSYSCGSSKTHNLIQLGLPTAKLKTDTTLLSSTIALPQTSSDEEDSFQEGPADGKVRSTHKTGWSGFGGTYNDKTRSLRISSTASQQCEVKSNSNQDSGFDESITETVCREGNSRQSPAEIVEYGSSFLSMKGGQRQIEIRCCHPVLSSNKAGCQSVLSSDKAGCQSVLSSDKAGCHSMLSSDKAGCHSMQSSEKAGCLSMLSSEKAGCHSMLSSEKAGCHSMLSSEKAGCHSMLSSEKAGCHSMLSSEKASCHSMLSSEKASCHSMLSSEKANCHSMLFSDRATDQSAPSFSNQSRYQSGADRSCFSELVQSSLQPRDCVLDYSTVSSLRKDAFYVPSLMGTDPDSVVASSLVGNESCNVPSAVRRNTYNVFSLVEKDTCNIPPLVNRDSFVSSVPGKETCNIPPLVNRDSFVSSVPGKDTCNIPPLVNRDSFVSSVPGKDTCNIPPILDRDTCTVPSLQRRDATSCNIAHSLMARDTTCSTTSFLPADYNCEAARVPKAQITESVITSSNKLVHGRNKTSCRSPTIKRLAVSCMESISAGKQGNHCKINKVDQIKSRPGFENKRESSSNVNISTLDLCSFTGCFPMYKKDEEDKGESVAFNGAVVRSSNCDAVHALAEQIHVREATELMPNLSCINGDGRQAGRAGRTPLQPHRNISLQCPEKSPAAKDFNEYSPLSCLSQSEEEMLNIQSTWSTGSDIACLSSLESLSALNSQQPRDIPHPSKSNSSMEANPMFDELVFGDPHAAKDPSSIASFNLNQHFSHPQVQLSSSFLKKVDAHQTTVQVVVALTGADSPHNLTLPPTSSDEEEEEECENYYGSRSLNTNLVCCEGILAKCFQTAHTSHNDPSMANPRIANPSMAKPSMANPSMAKPSMANPSMANPGMAKPSMTNPSMANPSMAKPSMANPSMANPSMANPSMAKSSMAKPSMAKPSMAKRMTVALRPAPAHPKSPDFPNTRPSKTPGNSNLIIPLRSVAFSELIKRF